MFPMLWHGMGLRFRVECEREVDACRNGAGLENKSGPDVTRVMECDLSKPHQTCLE